MLRMTNSKMYQIAKNFIGKNIDELEYKKGTLIKFDTYTLMQLSSENAKVNVKVNSDNIITEVC